MDHKKTIGVINDSNNIESFKDKFKMCEMMGENQQESDSDTLLQLSS